MPFYKCKTGNISLTIISQNCQNICGKTNHVISINYKTGPHGPVYIILSWIKTVEKLIDFCNGFSKANSYDDSPKNKSVSIDT